MAADLEEQVTRLFLRFPGKAFSVAYIKLRYNLSDTELGHLLNGLHHSGVATLQGKVVKGRIHA